MVVFRVFLTLLLASPAFSLFFGPPSKGCRSDRDCPGFRRTSCEGRGPNFLFIFPTCGRQTPYTVPGKCDVVPDTLCNIGSECLALVAEGRKTNPRQISFNSRFVHWTFQQNYRWILIISYQSARFPWWPEQVQRRLTMRRLPGKPRLLLRPEVSIRPLPEASKENNNWLETEIQKCVFLKMWHNRLSCTSTE